MRRALRTLLAGTIALAACSRRDPPDAPPNGSPPRPTIQIDNGPRPTTDPHESLYQIGLSLVDHDGASIGLDVDRGNPVLVGMFYGRCKSACPLLISNIRALEIQLSASERASLRVLLVSFDGESDTPEVLAALTAKHQLDTTRWRLAAAGTDDARTLAALLGIQYRRLENGEYAHNSVLTLLRPDGTVDATTEALDPPTGEFVDRLRASVRAR